METKANLATGHARTAFARSLMRNGWDEVAKALNSDGNGCTKNWQQWAKYWKDKKSSTKRKVNAVETARQRTDGGVNADVTELSELEQRIVTIAGGLNFATGDSLPSINPFPEQSSSVSVPPVSQSSNHSESILQQLQENSELSTAVAEKPQQLGPLIGIEQLKAPIVQSPSLKEETASLGNKEERGSPLRELFSLSGRSRGTGGARRRILVATRSQRRRPLVSSPRPSGGSRQMTPQRRRHVHGVPRSAATGARGRAQAARRRLLRRPPPYQRRSEVASLTERFVAIEERRADAELTVARAQESFAQGYRLMAEAIDRFTNTVGNVAQQVIETIRHNSTPM